MANTNGTEIKLESDELFYESEYEEEEEEDVADDDANGVDNQVTLIRDSLKPYRPTQHSTDGLFKLMQLGDIDVDPDYQRDVVWNEARQVALIDSMFQNYYIPPVLFAVKYNKGTGRPSWTCIDGKQRLTSIRLFMDGIIPWKPSSGPGRGRRYWFRLPQSKSSKDRLLPATEKLIFTMKNIQCAEFDDLPDEAERDIFQRVQLGMALSPAEKLSAMVTPMARYVHTVLQKVIRTHWLARISVNR